MRACSLCKSTHPPRWAKAIINLQPLDFFTFSKALVLPPKKIQHGDVLINPTPSMSLMASYVAWWEQSAPLVAVPACRKVAQENSS